MDQVIKVLHEDHDIIMITGTSRNYTDSFLKRFGIFECFNEIYARPSTITDQGTYVTWKSVFSQALANETNLSLYFATCLSL